MRGAAGAVTDALDPYPMRSRGAPRPGEPVILGASWALWAITLRVGLKRSQVPLVAIVPDPDRTPWALEHPRVPAVPLSAIVVVIA
jgi:hypothetical protein